MPMTSIAGISEKLFVLMSKKFHFFQNLISAFMVYTFKWNFVYIFQINCEIININLH